MKLDWLALVGIVGTVASVISLLYAWISNKRNERKKIFTYLVKSPLPLATVLPDRIEHRLSIIYERDGAEPINIKGAYLWIVVLGNIGRDPIKREDIAPSDPLRIEVRNTRVLDIAKTGISRDVTNFNLSSFQDSDEGVTVSKISFDFLDYRDAASIRVLTEDGKAQIDVAGTIIGMPEGVIGQDQLIKQAKYPFTGSLYINLIGFLWMSTATSIYLSIIYLMWGTEMKSYFDHHDALYGFLLIVLYGLSALVYVPLLLRHHRRRRSSQLPENLPPPK